MYFFKNSIFGFEPFCFNAKEREILIFWFFTYPKGGWVGALNFVHPILKPPSQPFFFRPLV